MYWLYGNQLLAVLIISEIAYSNFFAKIYEFIPVSCPKLWILSLWLFKRLIRTYFLHPYKTWIRCPMNLSICYRVPDSKNFYELSPRPMVNKSSSDILTVRLSLSWGVVTKEWLYSSYIVDRSEWESFRQLQRKLIKWMENLSLRSLRYVTTLS